MSEIELETARLLARFKLQVRRSLGMAVDLAALTGDTQYATKVLREVEDWADDEELLLMVVRLRQQLNVQYAPQPRPDVAAGPSGEEASKPTPLVRDYRFGARG
ncbi:hypothetical protein E6C76_07020 [Pseudothauera nasutitermitis]|uniref:Uncharacterized protein n=1 Tax=Pseudothauera nasutitermitis TaxID=2565930 RepID=A0A4S4B324_9RHOO|nr:hypothetical protein [Pseudothauera nasutitermitis]THF66575.1 hypothetical protein E6C76_07020 [Pseudothauera nasutitermitis]